MVIDRISNLITSLKMASKSGKETVSVPATNLIISILEVLKKENYISDFKVTGDIKRIANITLNYVDGVSVINEVRRVSKNSKRIYRNAKELTPVKNKYGLAVVTTSKGIMTGESAKKNGVGGEVLFYVW